jgi:hypothetical protein
MRKGVKWDKKENCAKTGEKELPKSFGKGKLLTLSGPKRWETNNFVRFLHINFKSWS